MTEATNVQIDKEIQWCQTKLFHCQIQSLHVAFDDIEQISRKVANTLCNF